MTLAMFSLSRLTWLLNMADKHADRGNYAEAAQCMLHTAALAAEYISMRTNAIYLPKGAVAFASLSDNIIEESAVSDDVLSPDDDGFCESRHFTPSGLVQLVQQAAMYLEAAQMYEAMDWVYKVSIVGYCIIIIQISSFPDYYSNFGTLA